MIEHDQARMAVSTELISEFIFKIGSIFQFIGEVRFNEKVSFGVALVLFGVWGIWYLGIGYWVFGIWYLVFGIWYLVFGYLVFGIWYLVFVCFPLMILMPR